MAMPNIQIMNPIQAQVYMLIFNIKLSGQLQTNYINMYNLTDILN